MDDVVMVVFVVLWLIWVGYLTWRVATKPYVGRRP